MSQLKELPLQALQALLLLLQRLRQLHHHLLVLSCLAQRLVQSCVQSIAVCLCLLQLLL
jgi:hypothetical protein